MRPHFIFGIAILLQVFSCKKTAPAPVVPAFYYWQTSLSLPNAQRQYLRETACKKLYVKILDVGLEDGSGAIIPYAQLETTDTSGIEDFSIVPVVFITNAVFYHISKEKTAELATEIASAWQRIAAKAHFNPVQEFQIDCDWTAGTRAAFFAFLETLRAQLPAPIHLSATIRLHQYKFPDQTGVPPVDRGMLMCYNTGDVDNFETKNSIFDPNDAQKYLLGGSGHYPLPLDLALPVFSWTLVYRDETLWKIIPGENAQIPSGILEKGTFLAGHYLRPGDLLRRESVSPKLLYEAAQLAANADLADDATLAFFHLDNATLLDYPVQLIDSVCHITDAIRSKK